MVFFIEVEDRRVWHALLAISKPPSSRDTIALLTGIEFHFNLPLSLAQQERLESARLLARVHQYHEHK